MFIDEVHSIYHLQSVNISCNLTVTKGLLISL